MIGIALKMCLTTTGIYVYYVVCFLVLIKPCKLHLGLTSEMATRKNSGGFFLALAACKMAKARGCIK
jgi:hypothetical protein